ncbi:hypothetical protein [Hydrogenimonas sp.]|uniref:hypothetical protein n=1 Tax=Hydrogenimonas sp. TaxID=2231112 RepID=UPI00262503A7|nr:hypothetical protein [Hydrogenimonas sp.]
MQKKPIKLGDCPRCGEPVVERQGFYGCEGWREGCDFTVSVQALASIGHPVISARQMRKLLKGPTRMSFRMANGVEKLFMVELREIDGRWRPWIDFEAGSELEVLGACPLCGADVVESPLSYGCSRWEEGCEFAIFKNSIKRFGGKMLSKQKAKELLEKGVTVVTIRGFDGSQRQVPLRLDREFGCKIDFDEGEE